MLTHSSSHPALLAQRLFTVGVNYWLVQTITKCDEWLPQRGGGILCTVCAWHKQGKNSEGLVTQIKYAHKNIRDKVHKKINWLEFSTSLVHAWFNNKILHEKDRIGWYIYLHELYVLHAWCMHNPSDCCMHNTHTV